MTRLLAAILGGVGLLFGAWAYSRAQLPYNEEGRFFDASEGIVYDSGAVVVYGLIASAFLLLAGGVLTLGLILNRKIKS